MPLKLRVRGRHMEEFIVLGLVPGTSIQIDFFAWLKMATIIAGFMTVLIIHRRLSRHAYPITPPATNSSESTIFVSKPFNEDTDTAL